MNRNIPVPGLHIVSPTIADLPMAPLQFLGLSDDILYNLLQIAASSHPPHWEFPSTDHPHD